VSGLVSKERGKLASGRSDQSRIVERVVLGKGRLEIYVTGSSKAIVVSGVMVREGRALTFQKFGPNSPRKDARPSAALIKAVCRAASWLERCERGEIKSYYQLARAEGLAPSYVRANMQLAFLAPELVEALIKDQSTFCRGVVDLTSQRLPLSWYQQLSLLKAPA
jgi:hypothetical protein